MNKKEMSNINLEKIVGGNVVKDDNGLYRDVAVNEKDVIHNFPIGFKCKVQRYGILVDVAITYQTKTVVPNPNGYGQDLYIASYIGKVDNLAPTVFEQIQFTEADIFNNNKIA